MVITLNPARKRPETATQTKTATKTQTTTPDPSKNFTKLTLNGPLSLKQPKTTLNN